MRLKNFPNLEDIDYGILETSGQLSIIPKPEVKPATIKDLNIKPTVQNMPVTIIIDGRVISDNLYKIGLSNDWLSSELKINKIKSVKDVFFAYLNPEKKLVYQLNENLQKRKRVN
jgi:uncharacterized membrane protein YcaP (DUF421 family)